MKKKAWKYHNFTQLYQKSRSYATLFLRYDVWWMYYLSFHFGLLLPFYPFNNPKNQNLFKMKTKISSFHTCVPKIMVTWPMVPEIWCITYRRTDGWKKWHLELGVPPKNLQLFSSTLAIWLRHHLKMSYCNCCNFVHSGVSQCMPSMHTSTSAHRKLFRISICALTKIM